MSEQVSQVTKKDVEKITNENKQAFYSQWQKEAHRAQQAEKVANQHARDRLQGLSAPELKRAGAKQILYGWGLSIVHGIGVGLGYLGGVGVALGTSALIGASAPAWAAGIGIAAIGGGLLGGWIGGSEATGLIYEKIVRRFDKEMPKLQKADWIIGTVVGNPVLFAGIRNLLDGFTKIDGGGNLNPQFSLNIKRT